ncbi:MAG: hypothetical protein JSS62_06610 [Verrucomicrobia bacterium]|nr:hypothetical protein [Verrucomicrobiota bacterium]MBS0645525.1 hypothetical protein [Verrucomicrobiota bacterium]
MNGIHSPSNQGPHKGQDIELKTLKQSPADATTHKLATSHLDAAAGPSAASKSLSTP